MQEDRIVLVALGGGDEHLGHLVTMQMALLLLHLAPLPVGAMGGVHLAERLHRQIEDQLEVGHPAWQWAPFQCADETLSRQHLGRSARSIRSSQNRLNGLQLSRIEVQMPQSPHDVIELRRTAGTN